jgi:putative mRNA 3-end processing factor
MTAVRAFEPVLCHAFITESTFDFAGFQLDTRHSGRSDQRLVGAMPRMGFLTVSCYALGKAQRLRQLTQTLDRSHGAIENTNRILRAQGITLPDTTLVTPISTSAHKGALIPRQAPRWNSTLARWFKPAPCAFASGWMAMRGVRRRRAADRGFIVSDHADCRAERRQRQGGKDFVTTATHPCVFALVVRTGI